LRAERAHLRLSHDYGGFAGIDREFFGHCFGMERNERLGLRQTTAYRASSRPPLCLSSRKRFPRPHANSRSPCRRSLILVVMPNSFAAGHPLSGGNKTRSEERRVGKSGYKERRRC